MMRLQYTEGNLYFSVLLPDILYLSCLSLSLSLSLLMAPFEMLQKQP